MNIVIFDVMSEDYLIISVPVKKAPLKIRIIDDFYAGGSTFNNKNNR
jgi:hypothetical protein